MCFSHKKETPLGNISFFFFTFYCSVSLLLVSACLFSNICHGVIHMLCSLPLFCRFPVSVAEQEAQCAEKVRSQSKSTGCGRARFHADAFCSLAAIPQRLLTTVAQTSKNFPKNTIFFIVPSTTSSALREWIIVQ